MCSVAKDERRGWAPTEHKAISTSGTKVKHQAQSPQMWEKSWGVNKAGFYLSTGEEKGLSGPLSVLVDTAILCGKIKAQAFSYME